MQKFGTREWADVNKNIYTGCSHGCKYCYACYNALVRFKQIKTRDEWLHPVFREKAFNEPTRNLHGKRIMFPTQHDITPDNMDKCIQYVFRWLAEGNKVLVVSKPHVECVTEMCKSFMGFENQVTFRFTMGSCINSVLKFWEPDAPSFDERLECLKYAFKDGYKTSVSIEPLLDTNIYELLEKVFPYISDTIWIGLMNDVEKRVDTRAWDINDFNYMAGITTTRNETYVKELVNHLNPLVHYYKIHWKDSIKKVMGFPEEEIG